MSFGSEFQTFGAATQNARLAVFAETASSLGEGVWGQKSPAGSSSPPEADKTQAKFYV